MSDWTPFDVDGVRLGRIVEDRRVLVDGDHFKTVTGKTLKQVPAADVVQYIEDFPDFCRWGKRPRFIPVRLSQAS